jgi:hypothetical protein
VRGKRAAAEVVDSPQIRATCSRAARAFGADRHKATEVAGPTDLQAGDPGAQAFDGMDRSLAKTLQVGNRSRLDSRHELQQSKRGKGRDAKQSHALDDTRDTGGAS